MITAFIVLMLANTALVLWSLLAQARFLRRHPLIDSEAAIAALETLVRRDMLGGFLVLAIGTAALVLGILLAAGQGMQGVLLLVLSIAPLLALGLLAQVLGTRIRGLACRLPYSQQYEAICYAWVNRALPTF